VVRGLSEAHRPVTLARRSRSAQLPRDPLIRAVKGVKSEQQLPRLLT
jgi:hypothetical protein